MKMSKCECKECLHYDVCYDRIEFGKTHDFKGKNGDCDHFKDKSLFVELPCKVGDEIYKNYDIESVYRRTLKLKVFKTEITKKEILILVKTVEKFLYNYDCLRIEDFGKTVFLTEEQAKEKLKEIERK